MAGHSFSFEFFPPKDSDGEARLWAAMHSHASIEPDYISITYGAGSSTRERTIRIAEAITSQTSIPTVAHLTCVGSTKGEIIEILTHYLDAGIKSVLALRGDPEGGPSAPWTPTPDGLNHADQLVVMVAEFGDFTIGVGAFPDGHPASGGNMDQDITVLLRKEELGASYATTQFFFHTSAWESLVGRLDERGSNLPIIPGILPVTNYKQLVRMAHLGGTPIPAELTAKFSAFESDPASVKKLGIEIATTLCNELFAAGAPGLHFYTMNNSTATREIYANLGLSR